MSLSTLAILLLIILLILKELFSILEGRWQTLAHLLNIAIVPLLVFFCITVAIRLVDAFK